MKVVIAGGRPSMSFGGTKVLDAVPGRKFVKLTAGEVAALKRALGIVEEVLERIDPDRLRDYGHGSGLIEDAHGLEARLGEFVMQVQGAEFGLPVERSLEHERERKRLAEMRRQCATGRERERLERLVRERSQATEEDR